MVTCNHIRDGNYTYNIATYLMYIHTRFELIKVSIFLHCISHLGKTNAIYHCFSTDVNSVSLTLSLFTINLLLLTVNT